jgi:hypothetical protein
MNQDPIDLSSLDPSRDAPRWEQTIREVASRAASRAARRRSGSLSLQLVAWLRPALGCAAAAVTLSWGPSLLHPPERVPAADARPAPADRAARLAAWAAADGSGDAAQLLSILGDDDDAR